MSKTQMTTISPEKLAAFLEANGGAQAVAARLGKSQNYFKKIICYRKAMPTAVLHALCAMFDARPTELTPDPPPKPVAPATRPSSGYALELKTYDGHVTLQLLFDSAVLYTGKARIKNGANASELEVIQAISYAAHMIFKFAEQDTLTDE